MITMFVLMSKFEYVFHFNLLLIVLIPGMFSMLVMRHYFNIFILNTSLK